MCHSFSGRSIMSICFTPNSLNASTAADTIHGVDPSVPASPTPLAPNGLTGVGYTAADAQALAEGAWPQQRLLSNAPIDFDESLLAETFGDAMRYW